MTAYVEIGQSLADKASFGEKVLGPIFADFALRLWIFLSSIADAGDTAVLFCARGGFRLKLIYERFLTANHLTSPLATHSLMVSRIVAVRAALLVNALSAFEQIEYEMGTSSLHGVVRAISGIEPAGADMSILQRPYTKAALVQFLASADGRISRESIQRQGDLFRDHLQSCMRGCHRAILCDSGLTGSTMQLLKDGIPDIDWGCVLFARANYKGFATPHFARTIGLAVEADFYSPMNARTAVLRYWHLIESALEPALESVSMFERVDGIPKSNLEVEGWQDRIPPQSLEFLAGILRYIDSLPVSGASRIMRDAEPAYAALRRAVIWPSRRVVGVLDVGERSIDFGRSDKRLILDKETSGVQAVRSSLWREGAVVSGSRLPHWPVLAGIEAAYIARWAARRLGGRIW